MLKKIVIMSLVFVMLVGLVACSGVSTTSSVKPSESTAGETTTSTVPANTKFAVAVPDDPGTFTFLTAMGSETYGHVINQIYQPLFDYGVDFAMTPLLATSWDKEDDLNYIFHLREGVKFSDGTSFKASDVLFSMLKAKEDPAQSQAVAAVDFENTKVVDDSTIHIAFLSPYVVNFINISQVRIASEAAFKSSKDGLITTTCGTGPYMLKEYKSGSSILLEQNANYWGEKPVITEIEFKVIADASQRANALISGDVDLITNASYSDLDFFATEDGFDIASSITHRSSSVFFNTTANSVCENVKLRQAICYAIDKAGVLSAVYSGYGDPSVGPFTTKFKDYDAALVAKGYYDYDMEKAKAALAEANVPAGTKITIICSGAGIDAPAAQIIQASLMALGLNAEIVSYDPAVYFGTMMDAASGWDLALNNTGCPSGLGADLVNAFILHLGISGYKGEAFTAAINESLQKSDIADMDAATKMLYESLIDEVPMYSFVQVSTNYAYNDRIAGMVLWNQANLRYDLITLK